MADRKNNFAPPGAYEREAENSSLPASPSLAPLDVERCRMNLSDSGMRKVEIRAYATAALDEIERLRAELEAANTIASAYARGNADLVDAIQHEVPRV